jgi:hypothetical protein
VRERAAQPHRSLVAQLDGARDEGGPVGGQAPLAVQPGVDREVDERLVARAAAANDSSCSRVETPRSTRSRTAASQSSSGPSCQAKNDASSPTPARRISYAGCGSTVPNQRIPAASASGTITSAPSE